MLRHFLSLTLTILSLFNLNKLQNTFDIPINMSSLRVSADRVFGIQFIWLSVTTKSVPGNVCISIHIFFGNFWVISEWFLFDWWCSKIAVHTLSSPSMQRMSESLCKSQRADSAQKEFKIKMRLYPSPRPPIQWSFVRMRCCKRWCKMRCEIPWNRSSE